LRRRNKPHHHLDPKSTGREWNTGHSNYDVTVIIQQWLSVNESNRNTLTARYYKRINNMYRVRQGNPTLTSLYCHALGAVWLLQVGFRLVTAFIGHLKFLITFHCGAIANSHRLQFLVALTGNSLSAVPSPVLWYWLPTVDVPLPRFPICPHATATAILDSECST
jgi:hypothetical protein